MSLFRKALKKVTETTILKNSDIKLISNADIPLTSSVLKSLGYKKKKMKVYHATTLEKLNTLYSISKTNTTVSSFTKNLPSIVTNIIGKPEIVAVLYGDVILEEEFDIFSDVDENGNRWLMAKTLFSEKEERFWREAVLKPVYEFLKKQIENKHYNHMLSIELIEYLALLSKKEVKELKDIYIKQIEKLLKNDLYIKIIKRNMGKMSSERSYGHNELLIRNFEVKGVYAIQNSRYAFKSDYDIDFIKYEIQKACPKCKFLGFVKKEDFPKFPFD